MNLKDAKGNEFTITQLEELLTYKTEFTQVSDLTGKPLDKPRTWRVNGRMKKWIRQPNRFRVPVKHGLYSYGYLDNDSLKLFDLSNINQACVNDSQTRYFNRTIVSEDDIILRAKQVLTKRLYEPNFSVIDGSDSVVNYFQLHSSQLERECFEVLFLRTNLSVITHETLFIGKIASCDCSPREIIKRALELNASAIILCHNHPSGNCHPSESDKFITTKIKSACDLLEIRLVDHLIIGKLDSYSFANHGLI